MEITKATTMGEMLSYDMGIAGVLMQCGMHCVGCPVGGQPILCREDKTAQSAVISCRGGRKRQ